jgi:hypothetical protein
MRRSCKLGRDTEHFAELIISLPLITAYLRQIRETLPFAIFASYITIQKMAVIINNRAVSPCICAKVRYALGLPNNYTSSSKTCSQKYWDEVVDYFADLHNCTQQNKTQAKNRTDLFRP